MKRICVIITARPSYPRIYTALVALRARKDVELQIVAAASAVVTRFGRIVDQIRSDGFDVAEEVSSVVEPDTLANSAGSTGLLTQALARTFERLRPDVVVTIADRHETLATAIAASYQHIPLCHVQGGEVSGSIDDKVRNAVTQLADVHCVATHEAGIKVLLSITQDEEWFYHGADEGGEAHGVHVTGCPSIDLAAAAKAEPASSPSYVVVLQHAVTDQREQAAAQMRATIEGVRQSDAPRVHWFWPGEDAGGDAMVKELRMVGLHPTRNLSPRAFLRILCSAEMIVGNSSAGIRECSFLGIPAVNIGTRQQGRERASNVVDVPHDSAAIARAIVELRGKRFPSSNLYGDDGHAGERIAAILAGDVAAEVAS